MQLQQSSCPLSRPAHTFITAWERGKCGRHPEHPKPKADPAANPKSAADRVFDVAADLFYRKGIRAVGVEEIVREAGVAKISLYRSFPSKDDLIVAYLARRNADFWQHLDEAFFASGNDPQAQLHALMSYLAQRTTQPGYRGCPFINYSVEFPDPAHPGHAVAKANKQEWRRRLARLAEGVAGEKANELGDALLLLVEGAYAISQNLGGRAGPGHSLVWAAMALVEQHRHAGRGAAT